MDGIFDRLLMHPATLATMCFAIGLGFVWAFVYITSPVLFSLALSAVFYAALSPVVDHLIRRNFSTSMAVSLVMVVVVVVMLILSALLYPAFSNQFTQFSHRAVYLDERALHMAMQINTWMQSHLNHGFNAPQVAHKVVTTLNQKAAEISDSVTSWFSHAAFSLVLVPLATFFLLKDYRMLRNITMQALPNRYFELGWMVHNAVSIQLQNYVRGISIQALSMSLICTAGFWLAGIDYAPLLGLLVGLLNLIPMFGISLAKIPPVLVVLLSDHPNFKSVIVALAVLYIAQAVDKLYLTPHVVAKSANLHPLTILLGVILAGYYFGFIGLILAVPLMFSMKVIYSELLRGFRHFGPKQVA